MKKIPPSQTDIIKRNAELEKKYAEVVAENTRLKEALGLKVIDDVAEANRVMLRNKKRHGK